MSEFKEKYAFVGGFVSHLMEQYGPKVLASFNIQTELNGRIIAKLTLRTDHYPACGTPEVVNMIKTIFTEQDIKVRFDGTTAHTAHFVFWLSEPQVETGTTNGTTTALPGARTMYTDNINAFWSPFVTYARIGR